MRDSAESDVLPTPFSELNMDLKKAAWRVEMNLQAKLCGILEKKGDEMGSQLKI